MAAALVAIGIRFARPRAITVVVEALESTEFVARRVRSKRWRAAERRSAGNASHLRFLVRRKCLRGNLRETRSSRRYSDLRTQPMSRILGGRGHVAPRRARCVGSSSRQSRSETERIGRSFFIERIVRPARAAALGTTRPRIRSAAERIVAVRFRAAFFGLGIP